MALREHSNELGEIRPPQRRPNSFQTDVAIVGSGAAGLFSAIILQRAGLDTIVLEAAETLGGSSLMSGGMVWLPGHHHAHTAGALDNRSAVELYLSQLNNRPDAEQRITAFLDALPDTVDYLTNRTYVRMQLADSFPDYRQLPGSRTGRSLDQQPFDLTSLGAAAEFLSLKNALPLTQNELRTMANLPEELRQLARERREANQVASGTALIAALLQTALEAGVDIWTQARVTGLSQQQDNHQLTLESGEKIYAGAQIVWACGGFEWNFEVSHERLGVAPIPMSNPTNRGDALGLIEGFGGDTRSDGDAWWMPVYADHGERHATQANARFAMRPVSLPGSILVDAKSGERFTNEALNYYDQGPILRRDLTDPGLAAWLIFDAEFASRYSLTGLEAATLRELARLIDVPDEALERTVQRFNQYAEDGKDPHFGRGQTEPDRALGDPDTEHPNLATIGSAPFHALAIGLGAIGTNSGVRTDLHGRVLNPAGLPLPGHYAVGNVTGSLLGPVYPGAGGTLGPALVASFRAAQHIIKENEPNT